MDLERIVEQAVTGLGYECVDFETSPRGRLLRVFIDTQSRPGGVTVDDCAAVSNHLTHLFNAENVDYDRLEVSSPGLDRPLKREADFVRFAGEKAQLRLRVPREGQRNFVGTLVGAADGVVRLAVAGAELALELELIERARLVPDFAKDLKKSGGQA